MNDDTIQTGAGAPAGDPDPTATAPAVLPRPLDSADAAVVLVPVDRVRVTNPRSRNRKKHQLIVENIARLGLKRPITVAVAKGSDPQNPAYDLVCGQGRLEAFKTLGQDCIPAIVIDAPREDQLVMGLVENIARRRPTTFEEVRNIAAMREKGYEIKEIARKVDLTPEYINAILKLWTNGEELLLDAVERGRIPLSVAAIIADADDRDIQNALAGEYLNNNLRGKKLIAAKRLWELRHNFGKGLRSRPRKRSDRSSAQELMRTYRLEAQRQHVFVKKARLCETRLDYVVSALKKLLKDDNFINVLRAEKLDTIPRNLTERLGVAL